MTKPRTDDGTKLCQQYGAGSRVGRKVPYMDM